MNKLQYYFEELFHYYSESHRFSKLWAYYELFKKSIDIEGCIIECGVFKGTNFMHLANLRKVFQQEYKKLYGFDTFGKFPETNYQKGKKERKRFVDSVGEDSIIKEELEDILSQRGLIKNTQLIKGDILVTIPQFTTYLKDSISLLIIDTDIYEPTKIILEYLYPFVSNKGVIVFDDYDIFIGETDAVNEFFGSGFSPSKLEFRKKPRYIIKEE